MSPSKADRLITRITALHHSLEMDKEEGPSPLERDLMLGYLRELYDIYLNQGDKVIEASRNAAPPEVVAPVPTQSGPKVPDVPVPPPPAPAMTAHTARIDPEYNVPVTTQPAPEPPRTPHPKTNPDIEALFEQENGMGSAMMRQKVNDLTRALSINNRVLFANKLFGNDNEALNLALKDLNLKGSIDYARPNLVDLATRYSWAEPQRQETAREFIDLVRRRYA